MDLQATPPTRPVAARRLSALDLARMIEGSPDVFTQSDRDGRFVFVSPAVQEMLGWAPDEVTGASMFERLHPSDRAQVADARRRLSEEGLAAVVEVRVRHKDGGYRWVESKSWPLTDPASGAFAGAQAVIRDITDRKLFEEALRASEERFRTVVESLVEGVMLVAPDGSIFAANRAAEDFLGLDRAAVMGGRVMLADVIESACDEAGDPVLTEQRPFATSMRTGKSCSATLHVLANGRARWFTVHCTPLHDADAAISSALLSFSDITESKDRELLLSHRAMHDGLTGLPNRALLRDRLAQAMARANRSGASIAVLFVDLDCFKGVNDTLGHHAGDEVLRTAAARLSDGVRPGDTVARLGGDEFVIVCEGVSGPGDAVDLARRLSLSLAQPIPVDDARLRVTASIGVALAGQSDTPQEVLHQADSAMYRAKRSGRCVAVSGSIARGETGGAATTSAR